MKLHDWSRIAVEAMNPRVDRQVVHSAQMTVSRLVLKKGAVVPRHSHPNEQICALQAGRLRFDFDTGPQVIEAGQLLEIPSGVPHSAEALEDSVAIDIFSPPREDWIRGDDAYLRS